MQDNSLFVTGCFRSGASLVSNMLTDPASGSVILQCPRFDTAVDQKHLHSQLHSLGFKGRITPSTTLKWLTSHNRWGIQEMDPPDIRLAIANFEPSTILIVSRDIRAIGRSFVEFIAHTVDPHPRHLSSSRTILTRPCDHKKYLRLTISKYQQHALTREGLEFTIDNDSLSEALKLCRDKIANSANTILNICKNHENLTVISYEDFVSSPAARNALSQSIGWPLHNTPFNSWETYTYERARHRNALSSNSLNMHRFRIQPLVSKFLLDCHTRCSEYQDFFGYSFHAAPKG